MNKLKEFIKKAKELHENKYDYSNVEYVNSHTKVNIVCPKHGNFLQLPYVHLSGHGCPECANELIGNLKRKNKCEFIKEAEDIFGKKYDYSKVNYINNSTKICVVCPEHGAFFVRPNDFLRGHACPKCGYEIVSFKLKKDTEKFVQDAIKKHGYKYDYSKVTYVDNENEVCIICPEHGEFWLKPHRHLSGQGCKECIKREKQKKLSLTKNEFIEKACKVHGGKYDYSKVVYEKSNKKVCIICPEHGEFWQTPNSHLNGHGCPKCKKWKMEKDLMILFEKNKIKYEFRKRNFSWLKNKKPLELDFYLPEYNVAIECQGIQHFKAVKHFGGNEKFEYRLSNDKLKADLCKKHNVKLVYYADYKFDFPIKIINNKETILKIILEK